MHRNPPSTIHRPEPIHGFTLVELLVVITIIGILIALLLPAVQAAREAARRMQCSNNLKQLALAVLNYENQWSYFPPSSCSPKGVNPSSSDATSRRENWVILALPFLEQQPLYDRFDRTKPITNLANMEPRSVSLAAMLCPSDSFNRQPFMGTQGSESSTFGDNWARGNYAANASLGIPYLTYPGFDQWAAGGPGSKGWGNGSLRGVMGANISIDFAQMTDGSSNTVLAAEIRAGVTAYDPRGVWAMAGPCSSSLWVHGGIFGDDYGPNCAYPDSDDVMNCSQIRSAFGGASSLAREGMPCGLGNNSQQTARSMHGDGVNTCFADGSVHWISDFIQVLPSSAGALSVWDRLMASADGLPVTGSDF